MSRVDIPTVAAPGHLTCELVLTRPDAEVLLERLRGAMHRLLSIQRPTVAAALPAAPPMMAAAAAGPPLSVTSSATTHLATATAAASGQLPSLLTAPAAAAPPPRVQQPAAAAAAAAASRPEPAAATASGGALSWQLCFTTDAAEHSSEAIDSMVYMPQIAGLPGGEGHAGWLVSSSRGLLNLWEASPSGGKGEPALMLMHSQGTDYSCACLAADRGTGLLLAASLDRQGLEWVTAYSLEVESLLAPRGRCPMPHISARRLPGQQCFTVASLHSFAGALSETCVASYGTGLAVWPIGTASKPAASNSAVADSAAPKALWKAHSTLITALHKSAWSLSLFSGDQAGHVHMFNMREKPSKPTAVFSAHGKRVTGIHQINDNQLLTAAADGRLMVWDVRSAAAGPIKFAVPDGKPILHIAVGPFADSVAAATPGGLYSCDLLDSGCHVSTISRGLRSPVTSLTFNSATSEVVVAGGPGAAGTISVFQPTY